MTDRLINGDCLDVLPTLQADCIFADPPDGIGLGYEGFEDSFSDYPAWLESVLHECLATAPTVWLSFNAKWLPEVGEMSIALREEFDVEVKPCVQTFTFGQNRKTDLGNGHRPLWRYRQPDAPLYPDQIKVPSWRQLNGDKRAAPGGRTPLDVFDFPRVVGNAKERRRWWPTQLNEGLVERCIKLSTREGDHVVDPFGGTGTTLRVCRRTGRRCTLIERSNFAAVHIAAEHELSAEIFHKPGCSPAT